MESSRRITMQVYWKDEYESETWKIPVRWSGKRSLALPAGCVAGNGPEGRVVDRKGVWWTGRASGGQEMSRRGIIGPESVAAASGRLGNSWNAKSAKRGLSACSVEGPLTYPRHFEIPTILGWCTGESEMRCERGARKRSHEALGGLCPAGATSGHAGVRGRAGIGRGRTEMEVERKEGNILTGNGRKLAWDE